MRNALFFVSALLAASLCSGAETYPARTVRVVAPFAPGGISDVVARAISQQLSEQLEKSFIVDNRAGAGGTIASGIVAKATPDGHTLLLVNPAFAMAPGMFKSLPYDTARDFTAITQIMRVANVLVVHPLPQVHTLKDFIALAQAHPGKLNYGSGGTGSALHLYSELFKMAAKVNIVHVPYKGGGENTIALVTGQIHMLIVSIPGALPHVTSGRMRALAVTTDGSRSASMSDVPSMSEAGVPGMAIYVWLGLVGPARMPGAIVSRLHTEIVKVLATPAVKERFAAQDAELPGNRPEEFSMLVRDEVRRWGAVIKSAGIVPE